MLLDRYQHLFFNANFKEGASRPGVAAYRGELILKEGEVADAQGRRGPPAAVLKQVVMLSEGDELKLLSGSLDELQQFPLLLDITGGDLKAGSLVILYTVNIAKSFVTAINGAQFVFIPLVEGMIWNELMDLVGFEKGDFKGQSAADKVVTISDALKKETFKFPESTLEEALKTTTNAKRVNHGAV